MDYIDCLINGEIYLKRGPEPFKSQDLQDIDDKIYDLNFNLSSSNSDFNDFDKLEKLTEIKNCFSEIIGKPDYSGCSSFWQLFTNDGTSITMIRNDSYHQKRNYDNKRQAERDFVKLSDFLENATFVGREFKRTQPIVIDINIRYGKYKEDKSYMGNVDSFKYIVLYATQELFLIKRICNGKEEYGLINSKYTLDGNYVFFGEVYEEYKDKEKVYSEVFKQVTEENRKYKKR